MAKIKIKIKKVPTSNTKYKDGGNFPEQDFQIFGNNPLQFKGETDSKDDDGDESIGTSYPTEKKGQGTVEAEKGELIAKLKENLKLFKIGGKKHSNGGTDIKMEDGDFIFSNALKIKGEILKSEFGLNPKKEYTFAEVANKYIDMNEFHKLSESESPLEKKTGLMMIEKYKDKLAKLAFLQEAQKGMPNGMPEIAAPLMEKAAKIPQEGIPEGSMMRKGGQLSKYDDGGDFKITKYAGDKTNKSNAGNISDEQWTDLARRLGYRPSSNKLTQKQINKEFQTFLYADKDYKPIIDNLHSKDKGFGPTKTGDVFDGALGHRWDDIYKELSKTVPAPTPSTEDKAKGAVDGFSSDKLTPDTSLPTTASEFRDLGYSSPEKVGLALALKTIPSYSPTRYQNYGLQQALGAMSNVMPYNYQSLINESTKGGYNAIQANNAFGRTPQAMANNIAMAGQLGEQTSKIKGEEYNQNAQLYNQNQLSLAQMMGTIGADKETEAMRYDNSVTQQKENLWANRKMRDKEFLAQYSNAEQNRSLRNAYAFLGQSTNPNFRTLNADNAVGFNPSINPFTAINGFGMNDGSKSQTYRQQFEKETDKMTPEQRKDYIEYLKVYKQINKGS